MILRHLARQQTALRPVFRYTKYFPFSLRQPQRRNDHSIAELSAESFVWEKQGITQRPDERTPPVLLYSANGYKLAWVQYQNNLLSWINERTKGTSDEFVEDLRGLVFKYSRDPAKAALFNHASMAINNEFYFRGLTTNPNPPPSKMLSDIEKSFSSFDSFREEFLATAKALFGSGFVWLVQDRSDRSMRILATYNAGTPFREAHVRQQSIDMSNHRYANPEEYNRMNHVNNPTGSFGRYRNEGRALQSDEPGHMGYDCEPLLCVNVWQYAYIRDWTLRKDRFLDAWWDFIDWQTVERRSQHAIPEQQALGWSTEYGRQFGNRVQGSFYRMNR